MDDRGVNSHDPPLGKHKIASVEDDLRMLAEKALLSNDPQLSDTDEDTSSLHSIQSNDLPSVTPRTDSKDDVDRFSAEGDALASEFELSDESDSGLDAPSYGNATAVVAAQNSPVSSKREPSDEYFAFEAEVQKNHQIKDGFQDHWAPEPQDVVAAPEQHPSVNPENDEGDYLAEMMRNLGKQRVNELPLFGDHKFITKTNLAEGAKKTNLPVANHGDGIALDFIKLNHQNRDKQDSTLDELDLISGNEYRSNLLNELLAAQNGKSVRRSDGFFASGGGYTRKQGGSPLRGGRGGGHVGSKSRSNLNLGRRLSLDASENIPPPPPPNDLELAEALALARWMKFNPADGKSSRGRGSTIHSSMGRSAGTTRATFVAAKTKAQSSNKTTKRSRQASFTKDTSARHVVTTKFNDGWLRNDTLALASKSTSCPPSVVAPARPNSAPCLSQAKRQPSAETTTRSSHGVRSVVQVAYNSSVLFHQSAQDYEDEYGPDNIYGASQPPPAQLISLSPVRSAASDGVLLDLRELHDEDNLDWMSLPVLQPSLLSEAAMSNQPAVGVETVDDGNGSSLLIDFGSPSRITGQLSASPSFRRHGSISGSTMPLSLMDQCFLMDKELPGGRGVGEIVENIVAVAAVVSTDGRIRYGRDELLSMRHNTPPDLVVSIVDNIPANFHSWSLRLRTQSRSSTVVPPKPPQSQAEITMAAHVELPAKVKKTSGLGASKWASPKKASSAAKKAPPPPAQTEDTTGSVLGFVFEVQKASSLGGLGDSKWALSDHMTSTALEPQAKNNTGTRAGTGSTVDDFVKTKKLGGLADSKYASPEKKSPEKPALVSSRGAGKSTLNRPSPPLRQSSAPGGSNDGNAERGRSCVVDENVSPFLSRRKRGGFGMDGGDDESSSSPPRRRSLSRSPSKSPLRSKKKFDDEVPGAAGHAFVAPEVLSTASASLAERTNLHHHRAGAVHISVAEFGQIRLGAAAPPFLPPPPPPVPAMPAAFVSNSSQPLLLQGHAFITGNRGEVRRVRCGVRGSPWHDRTTNTVMANIIVGDRIGRETEMIGALHGLPYDLQGNRWHADLFQAVEDVENEEDAALIGPARIDPDLEYSSQPVAAVYSWQSGLEEPSLPRFVAGPNDNFGSPPIPIHPSVVPPSHPRSAPELPQTYSYPVPPPAANNLAHFHHVIDHSQAVRMPREAFPELVTSMSGATLVAPTFPPGNRRYTFGTPLMPNYQNHPGYLNPRVQLDKPNQELFNPNVAQPQHGNPRRRDVDQYFTEFPKHQVQTQSNPNQELFNHYVAQAQQPSIAQRSLQLLAQRLGPPVQFASRRSNVPDASSSNLPDGPPAPGTIFGNVPNSVSGRPDLAPEDAFDYRAPTPGDLARRSHFEGFDGVFRRLPRGNAAIPIVDPNAPSASRPAIRGILKRGRNEEEEAKNRSRDEDGSKRG